MYLFTGFPHEKSSLENNFKILETRRSKYQKDKQKVDNDLEQVLRQSRILDRDMNALKPEIITLFKQRQQMAKWLRDHGKTREDINRLLENWSVEERIYPSNSSSTPRISFSSSISPNNLPSSYDSALSDLPHHDENAW